MKPHFLTHCVPEDYSSALRADGRLGLTGGRKTLSARWCFDGRGRRLFERATSGGDYLLGVAEARLLGDLAEAIVGRSPLSTIVHVGSIGLTRARPLWIRLGGAATVAVCDTPHAPLRDVVTTLSTHLPLLEWYGIVTELPNRIARPPGSGHALICCLGETYSCLDAPGRQRFLRALRRQCRPGDRLLLTTTSDATGILAALSAERGAAVAEFNHNVLYVMNHLLDTDCVDTVFEHVLTTSGGRAEFGLRAKTPVRLPLRMLGFHIDLAAGEHIATFGLADLPQPTVEAELRDSGFSVDSSWRAEAADVFLHLAEAR